MNKIGETIEGKGDSQRRQCALAQSNCYQHNSGPHPNPAGERADDRCVRDAAMSKESGIYAPPGVEQVADQAQPGEPLPAQRVGMVIHVRRDHNADGVAGQCADDEPDAGVGQVRQTGSAGRDRR
ncbi:MAG: hypothetical protein RMN25_14235 [Anaerolineae bacterium]|nr:hypothetical protein [Thermoflexales bacterium]MDW8408928.1 hypothetical protein [Anaerolineae bacterium]